jgi:hypothetical protein
MKRIDLKSLAVGVLMGAGAVLSVAATGSTRNVPMEYQVTTGDAHSGEFRTQMNKFSDWEFVATSGVGERSAYAVFRRPKQ